MNDSNVAFDWQTEPRSLNDRQCSHRAGCGGL